MSTRKRIPGCVRCQERHVKCDKGKPSCKNCRSLKYPAVCEYASRQLRGFRQSRYSAAFAVTDRTPREAYQARSASPASNVPEHASDTTHPTITDSQENGDDNGPGSVRTLPDSPPSVVSPIPDASHYASSPPKPSSVPSYSIYPLGLSPIRIGPEYRTDVNDVERPRGSVDLSSQRANLEIEHTSPHDTAYQIFQTPARTLVEETDCKVFSFYMEHAARWIDIGSPEGYFHSYVPQLALRNPLLLAACLSCASHLMYLLGLVDEEVEQFYSDRVVSLMIPALSSNQANSSNEALLATVVILRMSEQFLELGSDAQRHLQGAATLFSDGTDWSPAESSLSISCFWTYLRESIRISFLREKPCPIDLSHLSLWHDDMTSPGSTDGVWTNRMTFLLVRIGSLCWGPAPQNQADEIRSLKYLVDRWRMNLPPSFQPWCVLEDENKPFPTIRYFAPWHVVAWQFYYSAKVMLAVYYPDDWANKSLHDMHRYIETAIVTPTRLLCGLCMSNTTNVGTGLNGSHLMAWCGRFLSGKDEQQHLHNFLSEFSLKTKWPTRVDCTRLEVAWQESKRSWKDRLVPPDPGIAL